MINIAGKSVFVTGHHGFFGRHICTALKKVGAIAHGIPHQNLDLIKYDDVQDYFVYSRPDYLVHAGALSGGIVFNQQNQSDIYHDNVIMTLNVLKAAHQAKVKKVVNILSSCTYPTDRELLQEVSLHEGPPDPSIEFFAHAKRAGEIYSRALYRQYGSNIVNVCVTNLYGPGDSFNLTKAKVVSALISKFVDAVENDLPKVHCFGDGSPRRELLFVEDAADAVVFSLQTYEDNEIPLNIGTGKDISIRELAEMIAELTQFKGEVVWETDKINGQMKKLLDVNTMKSTLGYYPKTSLKDGLRRTINWYKDNQGLMGAALK